MAEKIKWSKEKSSRNILTLVKKAWSPIITYTSKYTKVNAYNLALLADLAYAREGYIRDFFEKILCERLKRKFRFGSIEAIPVYREVDQYDRFDNFKFVNKPSTHTQLFIVNNKKQILISVRGTEIKKKEDVIQDIKFKETDFLNGIGQVHRGFYECFTEVKNDIDQYIDDYIESGKNFVLTGHSLGGAIATLIAAYLRDTITDKIMLYTYGSPRVGNRSFSDYFTKKSFIHYRHVNNNDIVTRLPFPYIDFNPQLLPLAGTTGFFIPLSFLDFEGDPYHHLGKQVHLRKLSKDNSLVEPSYKKNIYGFLNYFSAAKITAKIIIKAWNSIIDHFMASYFEILKKDFGTILDSYLNIGDKDYRKMEEDLKVLESEIGELERSRDDLKKQSEVHKSLAEENREDNYIRDFHLKEAGDLKLKVADLNFAVADKKVDLANWVACIKYYKSIGINKSKYLKDLVGSEKLEDIDQELRLHSSLH